VTGSGRPLRHPSPKKVHRFQDSYDCLLSPLRNDSELDLALLAAKSPQRHPVTKQSDPSDVSIFAHWRKYLWIKCRPLSLRHKEFRNPKRSQSSVANYTNSNSKNKTPGRCHTDHLSSQDPQPPPQLRERVVNALLDRSIGSGDRAAFATLCDVNAGSRRSAAGAPKRLGNLGSSPKTGIFPSPSCAAFSRYSLAIRQSSAATSVPVVTCDWEAHILASATSSSYAWLLTHNRTSSDNRISIPPKRFLLLP
jgi:hypothetical protein